MKNKLLLSLFVGLFVFAVFFYFSAIRGYALSEDQGDTSCSPTAACYTDVSLPPPEYNTFLPPEVEQSYCDRTFGTTIKRLTGSQNGYVTNSEIAYFNIDDSYFIATDGNITYLFDGRDGRKIKELGVGGIRPWWIRWPRADYYTAGGVKKTFDPAQHFYKYEGNEVRLYNVGAMSHVVLHKFDEYAEVGPAGGEGDVSLDGRYWVFDGKRKSDSQLELFAYDLLDDQKGSVSPFEVGSVGGAGSGADFATVSPSGRYIVIAWDAGPNDPFNDHYGVEVFDRASWKFVSRVHPSRIHIELGYDAFGEEVVFTAAGNSSAEIATFGIPGLAIGDQISVRLRDEYVRKLLDVPNWAHFVLSYSPGLPGYIFVGYDKRSDSPETLWAPYWGEIYAVATDGSGKAIRLVHHRSWKVGNQSSKEYQPDFFVSNKGDKIVFNSTFGIGRADLYMFDTGLVGEIQPPPPPPPPPLPANQPPVAYGGSINTTQGVPVSGTLNGNDPDGNPLKYMIVSNGSLGKVTVTDISKGTYSYTPNAQTIGTDTFTFKVNDGQADSNIATVVVTIQTSLRSTNIPLPPPNYSSFIPPKVGASYPDPTFGTVIKRLTDSGKVELGANEVSCFNNNDSCFIAVDNGLTYLMDALDGRKIKVLEGKTMKPWYIRWPRANYYKASGVIKSFDPTKHFYKIEGNEIRLYNIDSLSYTLLRKFDEYTEIGPVGGRSEISEGGRHWLLDGKKLDGKQVLFIYDLVADLKGTECPFDPGVIANSKSPGVHFGTVSPSGKYVVLTWNTGSSSSWNDHFGVEVFDRSTWKFVRRVIPIWTKFELGYDTSGQEMLFAMAGNSPEDIKSLKIPDLALGDLISVRLADGVGKKLLDVPLRAGYSLAYGTRQKNFVFLSMEANSTSPEKQWAPYWGEILAVSTDGSGKVVRLVHHRSRQVGSYSYSPNFIVDNKGTKIIYKSTYGIGGPDLYMIFFNLQ